MTTDLIWAGITEKRPFLRLAEKCFFGQKSVFPHKRPKIFKKTDILEKGTFLFAQFLRSWPEHGLHLEVGVFFGAENSVLGHKKTFEPARFAREVDKRRILIYTKKDSK